MNKYSQIFENYDLGSLKISKSEFYNYKSFIDSTLNILYDPNKREKIEGLGLFIKALPCEKVDGRDYSILNKVNTNVLVLKYLVSIFKPEDFDNLKYLINKNKREIFFEDGKYFPEIRKIIKNTESVGERNEEFAMEYIKNVVKTKFNKQVEIERNPTSSYKDLILGVDIEFKLDNKLYTCQVKPLVRYRVSDELFMIESSGNIKYYKTDYISFVDSRKGEILMFQNRNIKIESNTITINSKFIVR